MKRFHAVRILATILWSYCLVQCVGAAPMCSDGQCVTILPPAMPCLNGGSWTGSECKCVPGFGGDNCGDARRCQQPPELDDFCLNGGTCYESDQTAMCHCVPGYTGKRCEDSVDDCKQHQCHHESKCIDALRTYKCECPSHRIGRFCQFENPCNEKSCNAAGKCIPLPHTGGYKCSCNQFFTGPNCTIDVDECAGPRNPCQHGKCVNSIGGFHCECNRGWTGTFCEAYTDECAPKNPCFNGGTCVDRLGDFDCQCKPGWTGKQCNEIQPFSSACRSLTCLVEGACQRDPRNGAEKCVCPARFTGEVCDKFQEDPCKLDRCKNDATCVRSPNWKSFTCQCPPGFAGSLCDRKVESCSDSPCENGECIDNADGFSCLCDAGFDGPRCSNNIDDCFEFACHNKGICIDGINSFSCACPSTHYGDRCQHNVSDPCHLNPCFNGATCQMFDVRGNFQCTCAPGFTGQFCEVASDERCTQHSCLFNGVCEASGICKCAPGYSGKRCEHETDRCRRERCRNGGTCENVDLTGFTCYCPFGFAGTHCEEFINVDRFSQNATNEASTCANSGCKQLAGDGICDMECNLPGCDYDGGDCSAAIARPFEKCLYERYCKYVFRDGHCDAACNTEACLFDGFDCGDATTVCPANLECHNRFGNGVCDPECNIPGCGFDGGDCGKKVPFSEDLILDLDVEADRFVTELLPTFLMHVSVYLRASVAFSKDEQNRLRIYRYNIEKGEIGLIDFKNVAESNESTDFIRVYLEIDATGCQLEYELSSALNVSLTTDSKPHCLTGVNAATNLIATDSAQDLFSPIGIRVKRAVAKPRAASPNNDLIRRIFGIIIAVAIIATIVIVVITVSSAYNGKRRYVDVTHVYHPPDFEGMKQPMLPTTPIQYTLPRYYSLSPSSSPEEGGASSSNNSNNNNVAKRPRLTASSSGDEGIVRDLEPVPYVPDRMFTRLHEHVSYKSPIAAWTEELAACLNVRDAQGRNALHWASDAVSSKPDNEILTDVMTLIAAGESPACRDDSGCTPLQVAIRRGRPHVAHYLMNSQSVHSADNDNRTPLYDAVCAGLSAVVHELLTKYHVNPNVLYSGWDTPLHKAVRLGQRGLTIIDSLLASNVTDVNKTGERQDLGYRGVTALHLAAEFGNVDALRKLLNRGANIGACDIYNETPLHYAIHNEQLAAVHILVAYGGESVVLTVSDFDQNCEALALAKGNGFIISTIQGVRGNNTWSAAAQRSKKPRR